MSLDPYKKLAGQYWKKYPLRPKVFLALAICLFAVNLVTLGNTLVNNHQARQKNPYFFPGYKYLGLDKILAGQKRIGYLTDKNMDERINAMEFAQAEYVLAPVTLDLNNSEHRCIILNFSQPSAAYAKMKDLGLAVWKQNQFGVILARNPKFSDK